MNTTKPWKRYQQYLCRIPSIALSLDVSRMRFDDGFLERMALPLKKEGTQRR
jgi:glucose-6-phosphate isomerase